MISKVRRTSFDVVLLTCFLLLSFVTVMFFFTSCENDMAKVNSVTAADQKNLPIETSTNAEFLYSDSAQVRSSLKTPQIDHYLGKKPYYEMPKGMTIVFYDGNKKEQTKLSANYGIGYDNANHDNKMNIMEAKGNVIVVNEKGEMLNSEHLTWNPATKKIYTDEFVKITTKDEVIWGDGLESNEDFSEYEIKHVKGQIAVKDSAFQQKTKQ